MNRTVAALICSFATLSTAANGAESTEAQDRQMLAVIKEIQAQQIQIADNQAKIEVKLVDIAEAVRVAKIYASRAGH